MTLSQRRVIFLASNNANFLEMYKIATYLVREKIAIPAFIIENYSVFDLIDSVNTEGFLFLNRPSRWRRKLSSIFRAAQKYLFNSISVENVKIGILTGILKGKYIKCQAILSDYEPSSVVFRGDRHLGSGWEPAMLRACKDRGIARVVINWAYPSFPEHFLSKRSNIPECNADNYPDIKNTFSNQYLHDPVTGKNILYRPGYEIKALEKQKMLSKNPWVMGGGESSLLLIDGELNKKRYLQCGVDKHKIQITGTATHDKLYTSFAERNNNSEKIFKKYNLEPGQKLVVFSPSPLFEEKVITWNEAEKLFSKLCKQFSTVQANVLLSLHPRMSLKRYRPIIDRYHIARSEEPLFHILPSADVFSSSFSSTVQWAVLCGVPTVVFDISREVVPIFSDIDGIDVVKDVDVISCKINEILGSEIALKERKLKLSSQAPTIAPFDGKCTERIVQALIS